MSNQLNLREGEKLVKPVANRQEKYAAKNNATAIGLRFTDMKTAMDTNQASVQQVIHDHQKFVRDTLDIYGIAAIFSVPYQAVCMKCYGKQNRFGGLTLTNEITRILNDYSAQGLTEDMLKAIGAHFSVAWEAPA
jgi:hypothetical protein